MSEKTGKRRKIRLGNFSEVHEFVLLADACDFDINIGYDRILIDAKSLVGVLGLDLGRELMVEYDGENSALEKYLSMHEV